MTITENRTKERPILFSGPMVRAILDGRKTQTRRIVKPQPEGCSPKLHLRDCEWQVGGPAWVRETWTTLDCHHGQVAYRATDESNVTDVVWRPSIHMPRWASRITLEITGVRVERLQDISEDDAMAEGVTIKQDARIAAHVAEDTPARMEFWHLWQSINGPESWEQNPWVWVIEFRKV